MGIHRSGVLGSFAGKIGPVVGAAWKDKSLMRALPKAKKKRKINPIVQKQMARFNLAADFLRKIQPLLETTYPGYKNTMGSRNAALGKLMRSAIAGEYPDFTIDYSRIDVASGNVGQPMSPAASSTQTGKLDFSWGNDSMFADTKPNEKAIVVCYCPGLDRAYYQVTDSPRSGGSVSVDLSPLSGQQVHTWLSFLNPDSGDVATSKYLGLITIA